MSVSEKNYVVEEDQPEISVEDHRLLRKVDCRLLPVFTLLYLLSFLDRSNIGNAKLDGMTTDLGVSPASYNTALAIYFVGYVVFEIPANVWESNLLSSLCRLKKCNPQVWLPSLTLAWGIVSIGQGLVKNQAGLFGIRFLLGATEAGLFPGVIYVFSVYYLRRERSWRVAIFFGGSALAGAFGGIFAYCIGLMNGVGGKSGWQWIFILEGLLTAVVSLIAYFIVPTWSHKAKFLSETEKTRLLDRLRADSDAGTDQTFKWSSVGDAFSDHLVWAYAFLFHGFSFVLYSLSLFLPTIIAGLGFETWQAQLMTVPPNVLASFSIWTTVYFSSKYNARAPFIIGAAIVSIIGYILLITCTKPGLQYFGVHLAAAGVYTGNSLLLSWPGENVSGQAKRAVAVALQISVGDIGAIAGCLIYRPTLASHLYRTPNLIAIGYLLFAIVVTTYLWVMMSMENKRRDRLLSKGESKDETEEERIRLGDRSVRYRYRI
ncbi:major facilitator superfamily domain-containing protein [Suillus discolor]|uniref:Major facilitator superfamily domain-containing protein n=1 Tax=Suillus discolor TaxID=1912936 RepID=A0A9P7F0E0_9AGAM|nr:major facilitator superfamily domain-containing protein [Suillus discolor]KAG2100382.1 major facilitator superfamily domain-containing protein [Suillus discolor]